MPDPTIVSPATDSIPPAKENIFSLAKTLWGAGGALATLVATMLFNHSPAATSPTTPKAATAAPSSTPRTVNVVSLFDCQYLTFTDPFFILHLPQCTNCIARKK